MILQTNHLSKSFGTTVALDDVTLEIGAGATGLLGPNGAGKTTLLRVLLGLLPAKGTASVLGVDPMRSPREVRARLGYMPESECLVPGLYGVDTVSFMGRLAGMPARAAFKRAHEVMYFVGLGEERYRDASEYSTGMQQRLKLAIALVHDPELLFLDEPTNGLDPRGRDEMLTLIAELARDHQKHILLSSHLLKDVELVCREVVMLRGGSVARRGDIKELTAGQTGAYLVTVANHDAEFRASLTELGAVASAKSPVHVVLPLGATTELIFEASRRSQARVKGLMAVRRSLEDVFLDAVEEPHAG